MWVCASCEKQIRDECVWVWMCHVDGAWKKPVTVKAPTNLELPTLGQPMNSVYLCWCVATYICDSVFSLLSWVPFIRLFYYTTPPANMQPSHGLGKRVKTIDGAFEKGFGSPYISRLLKANLTLEKRSDTTEQRCRISCQQNKIPFDNSENTNTSWRWRISIVGWGTTVVNTVISLCEVGNPHSWRVSSLQPVLFESF